MGSSLIAFNSLFADCLCVSFGFIPLWLVVFCFPWVARLMGSAKKNSSVLISTGASISRVVVRLPSMSVTSLSCLHSRPAVKRTGAKGGVRSLSLRPRVGLVSYGCSLASSRGPGSSLTVGVVAQAGIASRRCTSWVGIECVGGVMCQHSVRTQLNHPDYGLLVG